MPWWKKNFGQQPQTVPTAKSTPARNAEQAPRQPQPTAVRAPSSGDSLSLEALLARIQESRVKLSEDDLRLFTNAGGIVTAAVFGWPPGVTPPVVSNPEKTFARFLNLPQERISQAQQNLKGRGRSGFGLDLVPPSEKYAQELSRGALSQWDEDRADALSRLLREYEDCTNPARQSEIRQIAHDIGKSAYDNGWIFRMMLVYKRTGHLLGRTPPGLEAMWDGIGSWAS